MISEGFIQCCRQEINLSVVLRNGQSFRWKEEAGGVLRGVAKHRLWRLKQTDKGIEYRVEGRFSRAVKDNKTIQEDSQALLSYLQLNDRTMPSLARLYADWSQNDSYFAKILSEQTHLLTGIRILCQHPVECLFSFICSSNNNISRICQMVSRLCKSYGEKLSIEDRQLNDVNDDGTILDCCYFDFPLLESLCAEGVESNLRKLGFGYRAKYVTMAARQVRQYGGEKWLHSLIGERYERARTALLRLTGVGPKVADCICLMSLNKANVVPVDTHVWQVTAKHYIPSLTSNKSLTVALHNQIGDFYRKKFGPYAGWAQTVLFSAQLKQFEQENGKNGRKRQKAVKLDSGDFGVFDKKSKKDTK